MKEIKVGKSRNIKSIFYHQKSEELWVEFLTDELYKFEKVSKEIADNLNKSDSKGKYFQEHIRNKFKYSKI